MPEIPDLEYIVAYIRENVVGRTIIVSEFRRPVVLRIVDNLTLRDFDGRRIETSRRHGPFLHFGLSGNVALVMNLMLSGKLQHQRVGEKSEGHVCCSWRLDDGSMLNLCDQNQMAKAYLVRAGDLAEIPRYADQGVDVMAESFTPEKFLGLAGQHRRKQVRVFLKDHTLLSAIGNAYADEILFEAKIHPKTFVAKLRDEELRRLYEATRAVLLWGTEEVRRAGQPIQAKVREHLRVRNRKGKPCPRCGTKIRREGVRGYDVFFCPRCQPATRKLFLDWKTIS